MSHLIFDIETIPDLAVWTPPAPDPTPTPPTAEAPVTLPGQLSIVPNSAPPPQGAIVIPPVGQTAPKKSRSRKKPLAPGELAKEPFPPLYAHRVIAIGWTWLDLDGPPQLRGLGCVGTRMFGDNEAALLSAWDDFVRRENPTVVTWNGRRFEVPVLGLRSMRHGIAQAWADGEYRRRYGDRHVDLCEHVTDYGLVSMTGYTLDNMAQLIGLPGKGEVSGPKVKEMWMRGEVEKIEAYCASDSVKTAFLLLRYKLMRGQITRERYLIAAHMLLEACVPNGLGNVAMGIDSKRLLLED